MRKRLLIAIMFALLAVGMVGGVTASAHTAPPCNDANGDGSPSGAEYAAHHISALAQIGGLGNDGHKPGAHQGFSLCNPSGK